MNRMVKRTFSIVLTAVAVLLIQAGSASSEIKFGTLPRLSAAEMESIFKPFTEYLSRETGEQVTLVIPKTFEAFKEAAKQGQIDLGFANPLIYVQIKDKTNIDPLALSAEVKSGTRMRGIIIARKDSQISKVQDLKGKKLIFMEKDSAAGYIFQMLLMSKAGLDVHKDITLLPFGKKHENVARSVIDKIADAGGIREDELEKIKDKVDISKLRIVGYTDYFPNWPLFATPRLKPETAAKVRAALLKLKPNDPKNESILGPARLTGFIPVSDKEYDDMRKAAAISDAM